MHPDPQLVQELVDRIVDAVHPLRIILFGSAARGEMGPDSDLDVLVVVPDGTHRRETAKVIDRRSWGLGLTADVVVVTEQDIQQHGENPYLIIQNALEDGREIYHVV